MIVDVIVCAGLIIAAVTVLCAGIVMIWQCLWPEDEQ